jgi:hypothetical protein
MTDIPLRYVATDNTRAASQSAQKNVQAVGRSATDASKQLQTAAGGMRGALQSVGGEIGKVSGSIPQFNTGMLAMTGIMGGIAVGAAAAGKALFDMAGEARAFNVIKSSFDGLAAGVGASSDSMLKSLQAASRGMISQHELVLAANRAMLLGVADSEQEMGQLMEVAIARGRAMGLSATQAFNDLVTGLGRMSPMILDNLGIVTGGEKVFNEYAESVGKAAEELTDAERKTALFNKVMSTSAGIVADSRDANVDAAQTAGAAWADFRVVLGTLADPVVTAGLQALTGALRGVAEAAAGGGGGPATLEEYTTQIQELRAEIMRLKETGLTEDDFAIANIRAQIAAIREQKLQLEGLVSVQERMNEFQQANWPTAMLDSLRAQAAPIRQEIENIKALLAAPGMTEVEAPGLRNQLAGLEGELAAIEGRMAGATAQIQEGGYAWQAYANSIAPAQQALADVAATEAEATTAIVAGNQARIDAIQSAIAADAMANSLAMSAVTGLIEEVGGAAITHLSNLRAVAAETYTFWINETNNAAFAQAMAGDAVDALTQKIIAQAEAYTGVAGGISVLTNSALPAFTEWLGIAGSAAVGLNSQLITLANTAAGVALGIANIGDVPGMRRGRGSGGREGQKSLATRQILASVPRMPVYSAPAMKVGAYGKLGEDRGVGGLSAVTADLHDLGGAASGAADALKDVAPNLEAALRAVPGLFGASDVTEEQMAGAARGEPQEFADNYLRRLRDEIQNGKDWEGVSVGDAAAALGLDGAMAAEEVLRQFEAAWQNQSLFANPENLRFIDMAAVQAHIEQQGQQADGAKNLRALFGIGSEEDVAAIAALGLEIQTGLSGWLTENGFGEAGTALASALGAGVKAGSSELGGGVSGGLNDWVGSKEGKSEIQDFADRLAAEISGRMKITPNVELPPVEAPPLGGAAANDPAFDTGAPQNGRNNRAQGVHVVNVASPVDVTRAGTEIARRMRRT